jgi:hypothetical protein
MNLTPFMILQSLYVTKKIADQDVRGCVTPQHVHTHRGFGDSGVSRIHYQISTVSINV